MVENNKQRIIATNETIGDIIRSEIEKYGNNADLNHIDVSNVTDMEGMFFGSKFAGDINNWLPMMEKNGIDISTIGYNFTDDELFDIEI